MKINKDKEMGLNFPAWFQKQVIIERGDEIIGNKEVSDIEKKKSITEIAEVISDNNNKFYLFTDAANQIAQRLKFDATKFEANFLSVIPNGKKVTYLMGDYFYRWIKYEDRILAFGCHQKKLAPDMVQFYKETYNKNMEYDVKWYFCAINLQDNTYSVPPKAVAPFTDDTWVQFVKMLIFTELSELETVILEPNQKIGTKKTQRYFNESPSRIVIVDSAWSKTLIKADGFLVAGHPRLQPYGEGNKYRKYIWIDTYTKEGYTREAKMLKHNK